MLKIVKSKIIKKLSQNSKNENLPYPHVSVFHWQSPDGHVNFGDRLADIITRQILMSRGHSFDDETKTSNRLLTVGSVLHFAKDGDYVWGSGINGKMPPESFTAKNLHISAVRGPLTANFLKERGHKVPDIFGDPALLVPFIFKDRFKVSKQKDYVFVPNLHDLKLVLHEPQVVSPLMGWNRVIDEILQAKVVFASSLHGLVIAEAFGIPALYVRLSETENLFKYQDYFLGTGRSIEDFKYAKSIEEAKHLTPMKPIVFDPQPLLDSFPWDLWY